MSLRYHSFTSCSGVIGRMPLSPVGAGSPPTRSPSPVSPNGSALVGGGAAGIGSERDKRSCSGSEEAVGGRGSTGMFCPLEEMSRSPMRSPISLDSAAGGGALSPGPSGLVNSSLPATVSSTAVPVVAARRFSRLLSLSGYAGIRPRTLSFSGGRLARESYSTARCCNSASANRWYFLKVSLMVCFRVGSALCMEILASALRMIPFVFGDTIGSLSVSRVTIEAGVTSDTMRENSPRM
mmetsp:Transcript_38285/g.97868  ORF Transcript_38285/g.97868 Transcript_38285/m.97868 type:complete len:238 (+) Transcript_38285:265-978(+)